MPNSLGMNAKETTMDLKTATPKEIDMVLAVIWEREQAAMFAAYQAEESLKALEAKPPRLDSIPSENARRAQYHADRAVALKAEAEAQRAIQAAAREEAAPFEAEYRTRPWRRYFLVVSSAHGHVHRERHCSTCNYRTGYAWIVDLADCDEREMVKAYGVKACTTCFPDAPTDPNYKAAAPDPNLCQGTPVEGTIHHGWKTARAECSGCGCRVTYSERTGLLRKHKKS